MEAFRGLIWLLIVGGLLYCFMVGDPPNNHSGMRTRYQTYDRDGQL